MTISVVKHRTEEFQPTFVLSAMKEHSGLSSACTKGISGEDKGNVTKCQENKRQLGQTQRIPLTNISGLTRGR